MAGEFTTSRVLSKKGNATRKKIPISLLTGTTAQQKTHMARGIGLAEADRLVTDRYCKGRGVYLVGYILCGKLTGVLEKAGPELARFWCGPGLGPFKEAGGLWKFES